MQFRSDGLPESRLLRAGGFTSGVLLLFPIVYVGLEIVFVAALAPIGSGVPTGVAVPGVAELQITTLFVGPVAFLSALSVIGTSLYGEAWLRIDGWLDVAVRAGGLAVATIAGLAILVALFWELLEEGLQADGAVAIAVSLLAFVAIVWIVGRSARSFLAGYRTPE